MRMTCGENSQSDTFEEQYLLFEEWKFEATPQEAFEFTSKMEIKWRQISGLISEKGFKSLKTLGVFSQLQMEISTEHYLFSVILWCKAD